MRIMYCKQEVQIKTKITDEEAIKTLAQPIIDFANKHEISFTIGYKRENDLVAVYEADGKTSAYCKGMIAEIKQMLKEVFKCKIEVLLYMY